MRFSKKIGFFRYTLSKKGATFSLGKMKKSKKTKNGETVFYTWGSPWVHFFLFLISLGMINVPYALIYKIKHYEEPVQVPTGLRWLKVSSFILCFLFVFDFFESGGFNCGCNSRKEAPVLFYKPNEPNEIWSQYTIPFSNAVLAPPPPEPELKKKKIYKKPIAKTKNPKPKSVAMFCNDGTRSGCSCSGSRRGCCSSHGGVWGCE